MTKRETIGTSLIRGLAGLRQTIGKKPASSNQLDRSMPHEISSDAIQEAVLSGSMSDLLALDASLRENDKFVYSTVRDSIASAIAQEQNPKQRKLFAESVNMRLDSLKLWDQEGNETVAAIKQGEIDATAIKPHIRFEAAAYDQFYADQSDVLAGKAARISGGASEERDFVSFDQVANVNHSFRYVQAISYVENLFGLIPLLDGHSGPIRWMDIGCGTGHFANAVNPARFGAAEWEIIGCDMQEGKIAIANKERAKGRQFFVSDAFKMLDSYRERNEHFDLVTMFEFLEHLNDPLSFIRRLDQFKPRFVLAASPLGQKLDQPKDVKRDRVHLWSFGRRAWEQMFTLAGFEVVCSSETRVGSYIGGLNWLSIICGPATDLRDRRQTMLGS